MGRTLSEKVADILGPAGRLATAWPDYEHRPGQLVMAEEVARALEDRDVALIEAGTGTGKTMAYLIPALLSGLKTVVSTGTKNLQEQIFHKDIPFIRKRLSANFEAAYLKGRENYLCLYHFKDFIRFPRLQTPREAPYIRPLEKWARETKTGDRAELASFPEEFLTWSDVNASGDRCLAAKCPDFKDCFLQKARRAAAKADLVIVNHHLFMADLAVRGEGFGEVIPEYEAAIFDEAHQLEDVATQHFGQAVSTWRLARFRREAAHALEKSKKLTKPLAKAMTALTIQTGVLSKNLFAQSEEFDLWTGDSEEMKQLRSVCEQMLANLDSVAARMEAIPAPDDDIETMARRAREIGQDLAGILDDGNSDCVRWGERRGSGLFLRSSPVVVASHLQRNLYEKGLPLIFTSATLTSQGDFRFFKDRMGILPEVDGRVVESPFDYATQTLLYVPRKLPFPQSPGYLEALAGEVEQLLKSSRGRAFVLFTSYRNLAYVAQKLAGRIPWTCLVQGEAPRSTLLERFRTDTHSVLLATQSFWQGVDVPGESLSAVIIDKLPFPRPNQPLVKARSERIEREGQNAFTAYMVPSAVIALKQGLGRLIRARTDRGVLAVLDGRLIGKTYGRLFLNSLPPSRLTGDQGEVQRFFRCGGGEG